MTYVITYRPKGGRALAISDLDSSDADVRAWCKALAATMDKVVLHSLSEDGLLTPVDAWQRYGRGARNIGIAAPEVAAEPAANGAPTKRAPRKAAPAPAVEEPTATEDPAEAIELPEDAGDDTEAHTYEGHCMKCNAKRAFVGHVVEMKNGSKAAQGNCPVCGTKISRMVARTTQVDEWDDEGHVDHGEPVTADDKELAKADPVVEEIVSEAVTEAMEDQAAVTLSFSHEEIPAELRNKQPATTTAKKAQPAKKAAPAKKAPAKKATPAKKANAVEDAELKRIQDMPVATCPQCQKKVPVMNRAGLAIFSVHPDAAKGLDRCPGSTTEVVGMND